MPRMFLTSVPAQQLLIVRVMASAPKVPSPPWQGSWQDKDPQSDNFHPNVLKPALFPSISVKMSCGRDVEMEPLQLPGSLCLISLQHQAAPRTVGTQQAPGLILQE